MNRVYLPLLSHHIQHDSQMLLLAGSRQVGKTTLSKMLNLKGQALYYLNWDDRSDQALILGGTTAVIDHINLAKAREHKPILVFDELHKYKDWKNFLKGFYDKYKDRLHIVVTGSAKLDIYKKGSDSLMGRYFLYRIHPLTVAEIGGHFCDYPQQETQPPFLFDDQLIDKLLHFGGYPEPFIKANERFKNRWQQLKSKQLLKEDIQSLTSIHEVVLLEQLAFQRRYLVGNLVNKNTLSLKLQVAATTIQRWLEVLELTYYCFFVPPWSQNVPRSTLKTPKVYLWDWSEAQTEGQKIENLVASHLLKAVHFWSDSGLGQYALYYVRNKEKEEVDFLVTKNKQPWCLVEVKATDQKLSKSLVKFQEATGARYAFQVVKNSPYIDVDCFSFDQPTVVPMQTFLSQLV